MLILPQVKAFPISYCGSLRYGGRQPSPIIHVFAVELKSLKYVITAFLIILNRQKTQVQV